VAIVSVCLGLRWSELAGLQWQDIDWLGGELTLRRAVVMQITGEVKTVHSAKPLPLDTRLLEVLKLTNSGASIRRQPIGCSPLPIGRERSHARTFASMRSWAGRVRMRESSTCQHIASATAIGHG